jgi:5-methylcytosine-specific restriction endonuclease McrA
MPRDTKRPKLARKFGFSGQLRLIRCQIWLTHPMSSDLTTLPSNRSTRLHNITCIYCGVENGPENPLTIEHVIARRFVPKGALNKSWSLIGNACSRCNGKKADLEDDISAITLQPDLGMPHRDPALAAEAARKAEDSLSRSTREVVGRSYGEHSIEGTLMSSMQVRIEFTSPPQLNEARVHELAYMHLQGFFYLMSYNEIERRGGFLPGTVGHVAHANLPDWGNPLLCGFGALTGTWLPQLDCICANGFFKIAMKCEPTESTVWSFAIEWNKKFRLVGFFGDLDRAQFFVDSLPQLEWKQWDATSRYRRDVPLTLEDDTLFANERCR